MNSASAVRVNYEKPEPAGSSLINRNIVVNGRRTSIRLEAEMWHDLHIICKREGKSIHEMCSLVSSNKKPRRSLTSAIRVFLLGYYRAAATEEGHTKAGHGGGYMLGKKIEPASVAMAARG